MLITIDMDNVPQTFSPLSNKQIFCYSECQKQIHSKFRISLKSQYHASLFSVGLSWKCNYRFQSVDLWIHCDWQVTPGDRLRDLFHISLVLTWTNFHSVCMVLPSKDDAYFQNGRSFSSLWTIRPWFYLTSSLPDTLHSWLSAPDSMELSS